MRTLFISNVMDDRVDTGCLQRVFHLLGGIARVSDITFVAAAPGAKWEGPATPFRSLCREMYFYPRESFAGWTWNSDPSLLMRRLKIMSRLVGREEPEIYQWFRSEPGAALVERLCARHFDLIWVERFYSASLLPRGLRSRVIVDLDDLEHRKLQREMKIEKSRLRRGLQYLEWAKLRHFERDLANLPYEFVVCSEVDKEILGGGSKISVVPNGFDLPAVRCDAESAGPPTILFVGVMDYAPNCDAVAFFAKEVFPSIKVQVPEAHFVIVGRNPTASVKALDNGSSVRVTGTVPSVEPYLQRASVVVAPLRVGGGTRIKILEAMAYRRPVVATTIGAEGLDVESGRHLLIADAPAQIADSCVQLLRDGNRRRELAEEAYSFVRANHDWKKIQDKIQELVGREAQRRVQTAEPVAAPIAAPALSNSHGNR